MTSVHRDLFLERGAYCREDSLGEVVSRSAITPFHVDEVDESTVRVRMTQVILHSLQGYNNSSRTKDCHELSVVFQQDGQNETLHNHY